MATERIIRLDPIADGAKVQWDIYGGSPTDWVAVTKPDCSYPDIPDVRTGVQSTTNTQIESFNFGSLTGLLDPGTAFGGGEYVNWVRKYTYYASAIPANHAVTRQILGAGTALPGETTGPVAGTSGWEVTPKLSPFRQTTGNPLLALGNPLTDQMQLVESAAQAAFTKIAQTYLEVGVSTMEHIIPSGRQLVGASTGAVFRPTYTQYANLVFDEWCFEPEIWDAERHLREMRDRGLQLVRVFLPFGYGMASETVVNEPAWHGFERFLALCLKYDVRIDVTGLETFYPDESPWRPAWLDGLSESARWTTFARWWKRCGQSCAGSPAVVCYDLINEPSIQTSGSSWYTSPSGISFGTYLCKVSGGRSETTIATDFYNQQTVAIETWDLKKPKGFGELSGSSPYSALGGISFPHLYLLSTTGAGNSQARWNLMNDSGYYYGLNKPCLIEESDILGSGIGQEEYDAFFYRVAAQIKRLGFPTASHMGWPNAFGSFNDIGYTNFKHRRRLLDQAAAGTLYTQAINIDGMAPYFLESVAGGNKFIAKHQVVIVVANLSGSSTTLTIPTVPEVGPGIPIDDIVVTVANGQVRWFGPFPPEWFASPNQLGSISYTATTNVAVAVYGVRVP